MSAAVRSLGIGLGAATLAMLVGTPAAFLLVRGRVRGKSLLLAFVLSPIIIPRMIIAVGMFYFFAKVGLVGTSLGLMIGHTVIATPYVVMTATTLCWAAMATTRVPAATATTGSWAARDKTPCLAKPATTS